MRIKSFILSLKTVQEEVKALDGLMVTNHPDAAALLYKYNDDGSRDNTTAGYVYYNND